MSVIPYYRYYIIPQPSTAHFGTGTIELHTKDRSTPVIRLENIAKSAEVKRVLSDLIEREREEKHVVGRDMYGAISHIDPVEFDGDGDMDDHNFN